MRSLLISLNHFSLFFELLVQCLHIFNTYFFSLKSTKNKNIQKFEMILHVWAKNYFVLTVQSLKPYSSVTNILKLSWLLTSELLTETYICMRNFVVVFFAVCYWRWYILWTASTHYNNKYIFSPCSAIHSQQITTY